MQTFADSCTHTFLSFIHRNNYSRMLITMIARMHVKKSNVTPMR